MIYTFDKLPNILVLAAVELVLPLMSLFELATTGTIDFGAMSKGRLEFPIWLGYVIVWPIFIYHCIQIFIPALGCIRQGFVFKILGDHLETGDGTVSRSDIREFSWVNRHKLALETATGSRVLYPGFSHDGKAAINEFLDVGMSSRA